MNTKKILISGYYGFDNFGDDTILHVLVSDIKKNIENPNIIVISNNPDKISKNYEVNSIYRFDFKEIYSHMKTADLFISGGGSLLQNVTSLNSLLYYLSLLFLAQILGIKTLVYAQGIGPIKSNLGKILTHFILKKVKMITVRDNESIEFLKSLNINSTLVTDPVWSINKEDISNENFGLNKLKNKVGIQLRGWHSLDKNKLDILADIVISNFKNENPQIVLISLQDSMDLAVTKEFEKVLKARNSDLDIKLLSGLSIFKNISLINQLDYLIGMRFHACLISMKFGIPTLALSYDPKVESLSQEAGIPYVHINKMNKKELNDKILQLILTKLDIKNKLDIFSKQKELESRQNSDLLIKMLMFDYMK